MNAAEWKPIAARMVRRWPHVDWSAYATNGAIDQMLRDLADLPAEHVSAACDALARDGRDYPPTGGQIRQKAVALALDMPPFPEVQRRIGRLLASGYGGPYHNLNPDRHRRALDALPGPVRAFVDSYGARELWSTLQDPDNGPARLRMAWDGFARQAQRDATYVGLPAAAGLPALERANTHNPRRLGNAIAGLLERPNDDDHEEGSP